MRSRVFGRTREARDVVSGVRGTTFTGQARAATSSYISPAHLTAGDVALDLFAMAAPTEGAPRKVTEMEPVQPFIRHLVWGPFVFHAGMTNEHVPTLAGAMRRDPAARRRAAQGERLRLEERGARRRSSCTGARRPRRCSPPRAPPRRCRSTMPRSSRSTAIRGPGKLVEIEVTAKR